MKKIIRKIIVCCFISTSSFLWAQNAPLYSENTDNNNDQSSVLQQIENDIYNLGAALGFMIGGDHTDTSKVSADLINPSQSIKDEFTTVQYLFATLSINYNYINQYPFIANPLYDGINGLANQVFANKNENQSENTLDSAPIHPTPVTQSLQNMLSITPDGYCYIQRGTCENYDWDTGCKYFYTQSKLFATALGIDNISDLFKSNVTSCGVDVTQKRLNRLADITNSLGFFPDSQQNFNTSLMNQLDSSLLTTPLLYDNTSSSSTSSTSSENSEQSKNYLLGLKSDNAEQAAENYIKYVTGMVLPPDPMTKEDVDKIITNIADSEDIASQLKSFRDFSKYFLGLRVYASRVSVAIQNIYEILGSRKKLNTEEEDPSQASSQALNEFKMATYRLYNPKANPDSLSTSSDPTTVPWQQMINEASPARVQKETALLLAEINYQLYLMRKQQEKLLLTNSVMLLQSATAPLLNVPDKDDKED